MKYILILFFIISFNAAADVTNDKDAYKEGLNFANSLSIDLNAIKNTDTNQFVEGGFTSNPDEVKYYDGVSGLNDGTLMGEGINQFNQSELKSPIIQGGQNRPTLDEDNTFISNALILQGGMVQDHQGNFCFKHILNEASYLDKSCKIDNVEYGYCSMKPIIKWRDDYESREITEVLELIPIMSKSDNDTTYLEFTPSYSGKLIHYKFNYSHNNIFWYGYSCKGGCTKTQWSVFRRVYSEHHIAIFDKSYFQKNNEWNGVFNYAFSNYDSRDIENTPQLVKFHRGKTQYEINSVPGYTNTIYDRSNVNVSEGFSICPNNGHSTCRKLTVTITYVANVRTQKPIIEWQRECDFGFNRSTETIKRDNQTASYSITNNECLIEGGDKIYIDEVGDLHTINLPCYEFNETYQKPIQENTACKVFTNDPSCSQSQKICSMYDEHNNCVEFEYIYSCEVAKETEGYQCGSTFYRNCETEDCNLSESNANFGDVASKLQTVVETAEDINEDPYNIKIFTGKSLECRKTAVGYNNCCADSGWGQDIGLSGCNDEEKELAGAKNKGLTISVGEYCAHSVLGACLEKKRSYCAFPTKIAKIVQQQGRKGQLNIGLGSAKNPDCRGLTLDEFESLNFDVMNFSEFYGNLNDKVDIPTEQAIKDGLKVN